MNFPHIPSTNNPVLAQMAQNRIDQKTKPMGALGRLETLALQLALIQGTPDIALHAPQMVVFAADHGLCAEGVSAFPQAVTGQMVHNMLAGGAAVNVFAKQMGFALHLVDAGVASDVPAHAGLTQRPIAKGTQNMLHHPAMSRQQCEAALNLGFDTIRQLPGNVLALGEMGIGNTSSAAVLLARLTGTPIENATGRGTGLNDAQLAHKQSVLATVLAQHADAQSPLDALAALGGFEIAAMVGAMLQAASQRRVVLVDGFIASASALVACKIEPLALQYMVFAHESNEHGHQSLLAALGAKPLLSLGMRLGEGTGALLAYPLLQAACAFVQDMASFESAGVSGAV